ncbi:MAG: YidC/Oxa1 family membrane protein insertase [Actinomycetota bacterium]
MPFFEVFASGLAAFYSIIPSYGLAIILLTVAVRLVLLPLSIKQTRSMREMQRIQPEVKKLQQKHKGDRQKLNEEMMKLYKEHGVNPFGGCLPLLLQLPVFIALYRVLLTPLRYMGHAGQFDAENLDWFAADWVQSSGLANDLIAMPDVVNSFLGIRLDCSAGAAGGWQDLAGVTGCGDSLLTALPYLGLIAFMGFTTYYQQKQLQASRTGPSDAQAQQMQMMGRIMPILLMVFGFGFPAGLLLYWVTTNMWTIGQQYFQTRVVAETAGPDAGGDKAAKKLDGKPHAGKPAQKKGDKPDGGRGAEPQPAAASPKSGGQRSGRSRRKRRKR